MAHPQRFCTQVFASGAICNRPIHTEDMCALHWSRKRSGTDMAQEPAAWTKPVTQCERDDCDFPAYARGLCSAHYQRVIDGRPLDVPVKRKAASLEWRVAQRLKRCSPQQNGCILADRLNADGYATGMNDNEGRRLNGYRAVWQATYGPIPKWAQIHHACANRACLNPEHLKLASQIENVAEMHSRGEYERRIEHLEAELAGHHCPGCCCNP